MGPICATETLRPYLPGHPAHDAYRLSDHGPVSAAPLGSASILVISWLHIAMMGRDGLPASHQAGHPQPPTTSPGNSNRTSRSSTVATMGWSPHECILDLRSYKQSAGIEVEDVAKRLMDYGFHAPTVSWPVAGTMMVEPTESESKEELDRFCDAMIAIHGEIKAIESGEADKKDNVLKHAPHTAQSRHRRRLAARLPRARWPPTRRAGRASTSSGLPWAASTASTATVIWSAPACRWRLTRIKLAKSRPRK